MTSASAPPIWHQLRTVVASSRGPVEQFTRCVHEVTRSDDRAVWVVTRCGAEHGDVVRLRRVDLARDLGVNAKVLRPAPGGAVVEEDVALFEGFTPGWRSPSPRSEAGERARRARKRIPPPPAPPPAVPLNYGPVWHEGDVCAPGPCAHRVTRVGPRSVFVARSCPHRRRRGELRLDRGALERGEGPRGRVGFLDESAPFFVGAPGARGGSPAPGASRRDAFRRELDALGLDAMPADLDALKAAWRARAKATHPDVEGGSAEAFKVARRAFEVLGAELRRHAPQGAAS